MVVRAAGSAGRSRALAGFAVADPPPLHPASVSTGPVVVASPDAEARQIQPRRRIFPDPQGASWWSFAVRSAMVCGATRNHAFSNSARSVTHASPLSIARSLRRARDAPPIRHPTAMIDGPALRNATLNETTRRTTVTNLISHVPIPTRGVGAVPMRAPRLGPFDISRRITPQVLTSGSADGPFASVRTIKPV